MLRSLSKCQPMVKPSAEKEKGGPEAALIGNDSAGAEPQPAWYSQDLNVSPCTAPGASAILRMLPQVCL